MTYCCPSDVVLTTELSPKPKKTSRKISVAMLPIILLFDLTQRFMLRMFPEYKEEAKKKIRQKIIRAAIAVATRKGYQAMTLEDVAKEVGVTKGTLYLYFQNKEELLNSVATEIVKHFKESMEYKHAEGSDLDSILR